jgi:hypothetical protein
VTYHTHSQAGSNVQRVELVDTQLWANSALVGGFAYDVYFHELAYILQGSTIS